MKLQMTAGLHEGNKETKLNRKKENLPQNRAESSDEADDDTDIERGKERLDANGKETYYQLDINQFLDSLEVFLRL